MEAQAQAVQEKSRTSSSRATEFFLYALQLVIIGQEVTKKTTVFEPNQIYSYFDQGFPKIHT